MAIVLAVAFPAVPLFFGEQTSIQNTFSAVDQLVLASETVTRYVHEARRRRAATPGLTVRLGQRQRRHLQRRHRASTVARGGRVQVTNGGERHEDVRDVLHPGRRCGQEPLLLGVRQCTYSSRPRRHLLINYLTNGTGGSPVFTYYLQGGEVVRRAAPPGTAPTTTTRPRPSRAGPQLHQSLTVERPDHRGGPWATRIYHAGPGPSNAQILTATGRRRRRTRDHDHLGVQLHRHARRRPVTHLGRLRQRVTTGPHHLTRHLVRHRAG